MKGLDRPVFDRAVNLGMAGAAPRRSASARYLAERGIEIAALIEGRQFCAAT